MNKVYKLFAFAVMFACMNSALFAMPNILVSLDSSLKQHEAIHQLGHGLHCGYYALWNAQCGITAAMKNNRDTFANDDRGLFEVFLEGWEKFISNRRNFALTVDNLEPNELDALVREFFPETAQCITVFTSTNQITQLTAGHGLSDELVQRVKKFRNDASPQAFLINTGADGGVKQRGTNHWIAAILTKLPPELARDKFVYKLSFHDSGSTPRKPLGKNTTDPEYVAYQDAFRRHTQHLKQIVTDINKLFITQDLELLNAQRLLTEPLGAVVIQCKALDQSVGNWEYVGRLEDAVVALDRIISSPGQSNKLNQLREIRKNLGMEPLGRNGRIYQEYVDHLKNEELQQLQGLFISCDRVQEFNDTLSEPGYAVEPEKLRELAINKLAKTYQEFVVNGEVLRNIFIQVAHNSGVPQEIIDAAISQVENPVIVQQDVVPMDAE